MRRIVSWMTETSLQKIGLVVIAVLLLTGYGAYTLTQADQELIPDIELPVMVVVAQVPGDQPEQVVQSTIAPIESATASIDNLKATESTSVSGFGVILYSFEFGTPVDDARDQVQRAIDSAPLPPDVQTSVLTFDPSSFPVVMFDVRGDLSQADLTRIAQTEVLPEISNLDGVATAELVGGAFDEISITLDRDALLERGITYEQVSGVLQANNVILPSGQLPNGESTLPLQTVAIYQNLDDIRSLPLTDAEGQSLTLGDIATVEEIEGKAAGLARTDGQPSISIQVTKNKAANTVDVSERVLDKLDQIEPNLSEGASISIFMDQAEFITESINSVIEEGAIGGLLAVIIVFLFLWNVRSTIITAVSIPLSIIMAIIVLDQLGFSLNIMTLAGLTIAIGRVIDDSIVVLENIYRHMAAGEEPRKAIINGAREVTIAIVGATATTCAVFLPLGLVGGLIGELFLPFALAVVAALAASLLVAVTVVPVLAHFTIAGRVKVQPEKRAADTRLGRLYTPLLRWSLRHRWTTLLIAGVLFIGSLVLVPFLNVAFLPASGENTLIVTVNAQPGETQQAVLEQAMAVEEMFDDYDVVTYQTIITGASNDFSAIGNILSGENPNSARITVELASGIDKLDVADDLRKRFATELPEDAAVSVTAGDGFSQTGLSITISAEDPAAQASLPDFTAQVADAVASVDNTANVSSNLAAVQPSVQVTVDPARAAEVGLTPAGISAQLRRLSTPETVSTMAGESGALPVTLIVGGASPASVDELNALEVAPGVTLADVATVEEVTSQVTITRVDGKPASSVTADITTENTGGVSTEVQQAVNKLETPPGVEVYVGGVAGDIAEGFASMAIAIIISIVLVYVIMAMLFGSWLDPFVILFSLPLAAIGAIVALFVTGTALSISALIGVLMLVGIVVTNAIVMLEFVIMLRDERGYSTYDALLEGAQTRLRPILMTAFAAMLALVPLSLGLTEGALIAADLGRTVIGGLFSSTLLTLLVIPAIYSLADDLRAWRARRKPATEQAASQRLAAEGVDD